MKTLIIEKPLLSPLPNRIGWMFFTALFWMVWIYLWMPLITLFFWWFGFSLFDKYFLHSTINESSDIKRMFFIYLLIVIALGGSLLTWAGTEFMRFHYLHRRNKPLPVDAKELANLIQIPTDKMAELSLARRMTAHHDENGKFLYAEIE